MTLYFYAPVLYSRFPKTITRSRIVTVGAESLLGWDTGHTSDFRTSTQNQRVSFGLLYSLLGVAGTTETCGESSGRIVCALQLDSRRHKSSSPARTRPQPPLPSYLPCRLPMSPTEVSQLILELPPLAHSFLSPKQKSETRSHNSLGRFIYSLRSGAGQSLSLRSPLGRYGIFHPRG